MHVYSKPVFGYFLLLTYDVSPSLDSHDDTIIHPWRKFWHSSKQGRQVSNQRLKRWRGFEVDVTEVSIDEHLVKGRQAEVKDHVAGGGEVKVVLPGRDEGGLGEVGGGEVSPTPRLEVGKERGVGPLVSPNT